MPGRAKEQGRWVWTQSTARRLDADQRCLRVVCYGCINKVGSLAIIEYVGGIWLDSRGSNSKVTVYKMKGVTGISMIKVRWSRVEIWNDVVLIEE